MKVYGYILLVLALFVGFMFLRKDENAPGCKRVEKISTKDSIAVVINIVPTNAGDLLTVKSIPRGEELRVWRGEGEKISNGDTIKIIPRIVEKIPRSEGFKIR